MQENETRIRRRQLSLPVALTLNNRIVTVTASLPLILSYIEFVTGRTGPRKTRALGPFPCPAPLNGLGRGVFFGIPCSCPPSCPRTTYTPDGSPLKIGGNKRGPVQGMSAGGPRWGQGGDHLKHTPPARCKGGVWRVKTRPAPPCNEH